jgi:hypothetical protein
VPKLPREPDLPRLQKLTPATQRLPAGTKLTRIYFREGPHPTRWNVFRYFGPTNSRFDHHQSDDDGEGVVQECGVMYVAPNAVTCLAEVFQYSGRTINRYRGNPWLVIFELQSELSLLDLTGRFPIQAGASMKLTTGPTSSSRNWARGFYTSYPKIDGLYYPSSMTNEPAMALNERANDLNALPALPIFNRSLSDPVLLTPLQNAAEDIGYDLI